MFGLSKVTGTRFKVQIWELNLFTGQSRKGFKAEKGLSEILEDVPERNPMVQNKQTQKSLCRLHESDSSTVLWPFKVSVVKRSLIKHQMCSSLVDHLLCMLGVLLDGCSAPRVQSDADNYSEKSQPMSRAAIFKLFSFWPKIWNHRHPWPQLAEAQTSMTGYLISLVSHYLVWSIYDTLKS